VKPRCDNGVRAVLIEVLQWVQSLIYDQPKMSVGARHAVPAFVCRCAVPLRRLGEVKMGGSDSDYTNMTDCR